MSDKWCHHLRLYSPGTLSNVITDYPRFTAQTNLGYVSFSYTIMIITMDLVNIMEYKVQGTFGLFWDALKEDLISN